MDDFFFVPAEGNTPRCLINRNCVEFVYWGDFEIQLRFTSGKNLVLSGVRAKAFIEQCGYGPGEISLDEVVPELDEMLE